MALKFSFLIVLVLALVFLFVSVHSANLIIGNTTGGQRLYRTTVSRNVTEGQCQQEDVYREFNMSLIFISAIEYGVSQGANVTLVGGGLGASNATLRFTSALSRGYNYTLDYWGRWNI